MAPQHPPPIVPTLAALGDCGLLVRFARRLELDANVAAIDLARRLQRAAIPGVVEVAPNLVSVLVRYDPARIGFDALCGEVRLLGTGAQDVRAGQAYTIIVDYGGQAGPDLDAVAAQLGLDAETLVAAHGAVPLRVLSVSFAPGFLYCGMHPSELFVPRRETIRATVPAGSVLFAAGQTAIAATAIPTGWSVIGHTSFSNFDASREPPTTVRAGDLLAFEARR